MCQRTQKSLAWGLSVVAVLLAVVAALIVARRGYPVAKAYPVSMGVAVVSWMLITFFLDTHILTDLLLFGGGVLFLTILHSHGQVGAGPGQLKWYYAIFFLQIMVTLLGVSRVSTCYDRGG